MTFGRRLKNVGKGPDVKPFYVYLDEFQRFVTPTLGENLDEAGGFGLHLTMAHQFPSQLLDRGEAGRKVYNSVMANAGTKIVFRTAHQADLDPLARELFMGVMDPDEIKLVLESTKVIDYDEEVQTIRSTGSGGSTTTALRNDEDEYALVTDGQTWHENVTEQTILRPVFGKETSSIQYRPLEEQLHRAMQYINAQAQRECIVRAAETRKPVFLRTPTVEDGMRRSRSHQSLHPERAVQLALRHVDAGRHSTVGEETERVGEAFLRSKRKNHQMQGASCDEQRRNHRDILFIMTAMTPRCPSTFETAIWNCSRALRVQAHHHGASGQTLL